MSATIAEVLLYDSFDKAKLVTGNQSVKNEVTGVMVMEAPDIEAWGRKGLLILTSYYAMKDVTAESIGLFFRHAKKLGIAGFVVKIDRLVEKIPAIFISYCTKYQIPLIQIDRNTRYEKIITEILESIINRNSFVLQSYYDSHRQFIQLMMKQPDILQILETLKRLIHKPVTLIENVKERIIGTDSELNAFQIQKKFNLPKQKYMNLQYQKYEIKYSTYETEKVFTQLSVPIPNLGYEEYELIIHELNTETRDIDFMAIENAIVALQTELVKRYALRQGSRSRLNEMASDLLHGRLNNQEDVDETIYQLELDLQKRYRIILFSFDLKGENNLSSPLYSRFADSLINYSKIEFPERFYVTRKQKVILIAPACEVSLWDEKQRVREMIGRIKEKRLFEDFTVYATVSNAVWLDEVAEAYRQAFDTLRVLQLIGDKQDVATYEDLGIYQIFVETDNLQTLERFIPSSIWTLKEENPELLQTLDTFINVNQNFSEAAQKLYVHPKTVRYRIERLKNNYHIDLQNSEDTLRYGIGLRLLKLLPPDYRGPYQSKGGKRNGKAR